MTKDQKAIYDKYRALNPARGTNMYATAYLNGLKSPAHELIKHPRNSLLWAAQKAGRDNARSQSRSKNRH